MAGGAGSVPRPIRYIRYIRYKIVFIIKNVALVALVALSLGRVEVAAPDVGEVFGQIPLTVKFPIRIVL